MPVTFKLVNRFSLTCLIREDWDLIWSPLLSDLGELYVIIIAFKQLFEQQPKGRRGDLSPAAVHGGKERELKSWGFWVVHYWIL